jgi:hypothetical protein
VLASSCSSTSSSRFERTMIDNAKLPNKWVALHLLGVNPGVDKHHVLSPSLDCTIKYTLYKCNRLLTSPANHFVLQCTPARLIRSPDHPVLMYWT